MPLYKSYSVTIGKLKDHSINEDAVINRNNVIAVSDGAGGGGLYADLWSDYLVKHLPDKPFDHYSEFNQWIEDIWEPFYNDRERDAQKEGGMVLEKFYREGSLATLSAIWKLKSNKCKWITYGDSVAFCYSPKNHNLQHSFSELSDFNNPPYLINCKDELDKKGYREGYFLLEDDSVLFVASDALAHYILMVDAFIHRTESARQEEIKRAITAQTKNSQFLLSAETISDEELSKKIDELLEAAKNKSHFRTLLERLLNESLLASDDFSMAVLTCKKQKSSAISKLIRILKCDSKRRG